jgi:hypothetical protein
MSATTRKNTPRLRDGVMKRGTTWSYVIRVKDSETGVSKPRWVGGFATEDDAKAARDEARVKARNGEYIDRNRITVADYLDDWMEAHAMEIKPRTLADYRACIRLYATPRIGHLPVQAVRPSTITKLYRDLLTSGGRGGQPLAVATVTHLHGTEEGISRCRHRGRIGRLAVYGLARVSGYAVTLPAPHATSSSTPSRRLPQHLPGKG